MTEESKYHFCWDKCQWVDRKVCESRIQKGKCTILKTPKDLAPELRGVLHKEKGETQIECEKTR